MMGSALSRSRFVSLSTVVILMATAGIAHADFTFGEVIHLGPVINGPAGDAVTCFSADGLEMYFDSHRAGGHGGWDIYVARRQTVDDGWSAPVNLGPPVNTTHNDYCASISANGLELYFSSDNRPGGVGGADTWVARRATIEDQWGTPTNLGSLVNSTSADIGPRLSLNGLELYFSSERPDGHGSADIWVTTRATMDDPWTAPVNLGPPVNSEASECYPFLSADGLLLLFSENDGSPLRPGGHGDIDNWAARRASVSDPWETPVNLGPVVNTPSLDGGPVLSPDECTLYFSSARSGNLGGMWGDTWEAALVPIVDFDGDGQVDGMEVLRMTDYWGTADSLCDIGPMPWGDGTVDVEDVKILADYIGLDVVDATLVAHWALDETEGDIAYDSAGDNDGALVNGPAWAPQGGIVNGALRFDGVDDHVVTEPALNPADGPFSVLAWIQGGAPGQVVISQADGANWLTIDAAAGTLATELAPVQRTKVPPLVSDVIVTDGIWHRVALVWDGVARSLYVDGALVAQDELSSQTANRGGLYIGCGADQTPGTFFAGLIDDIRIYNRTVQPQ